VEARVSRADERSQPTRLPLQLARVSRADELPLQPTRLHLPSTVIKDRPRRLDRIFSRAPVFFITFRTRDRKRINSLISANNAFVIYGKDALEKFNVAVGRYVIMPDHVHFFVRGDPNFALSPWVGGLKRAISVAVSKDAVAARVSRAGSQKGLDISSQPARLPLQGRQNSLWQPGFFDHVLRSDESYAQKWEYVRDNPVRAGLVTSWQEWPHQGEIVRIDRA
jgi:REP-associated tyrosine transposase